jgi:O-antigen/teichoic acid export membrane protein
VYALGFFDLGLASLTIQRVASAYGKNELAKMGEYCFSGLLAISTLLSLMFILGYLASHFILEIFPNVNLEENTLLVNAFRIALIALVFSLLNNTVEGILNAMQLSFFPKLIQIVAILISLSILFLLLKTDEPLLAIPIAALIRAMITVIPNFVYLCFVLIRKEIKLFRGSRLALNEYLALGPSLFFSKLGTSLTSNLEPVLINAFISPETATSFAVSKKLGALVQTFFNRTAGILFPSLSNLFSENAIHYYATVKRIFTWLLSFAALSFLGFAMINEWFVAMWVNEDQFIGIAVTVLISLYLYTGFVSNLLSYSLGTANEIKFASVFIGYESLLKVLLLFILVYFFGVIGIPMAIIGVNSLFIYIYFRKWHSTYKLSTQRVFNG